MMRPFLTTIILTVLAQPVWAQKMHCAFTMQPERWPLERLGSASAAIDAVAGTCKAGDHLMISKMYTDEASYFIATMCDPEFAITPIRIDNRFTSVNCVFVGNAGDRLE